MRQLPVRRALKRLKKVPLARSLAEPSERKRPPRLPRAIAILTPPRAARSRP